MDRKRLSSTTLVDGVEIRCSASCDQYQDLRKHLASAHGIDAAVKTETFRCSSLDDFQSWKLLHEANASVAYRILNRATGVGRRTFVCTRSGVFRPNGKGVRRLKSQGSSKLGHACTSQLVADVADDGSVTATVYPHHYGHGTGPVDLPHLKIPAADKVVVKEKLLKGVNPSRIIQDMRSTLEACGNPSSSRAY
ncbi:uncharacterized protein LOC122380911 [Amphibalanus amphitrite]|uniref:uncharacterized protein LOC122380911 n=1 Tax=Amphibalanus amphitrite TaxID=1232801 RepID=UPI001C8FB8C2|nr:uncharacterized protein LOC122380911 [Amphibalanus amphitrite]